MVTLPVETMFACTIDAFVIFPFVIVKKWSEIMFDTIIFEKSLATFPVTPLIP